MRKKQTATPPDAKGLKIGTKVYGLPVGDRIDVEVTGFDLPDVEQLLAEP